MLDRILAALRTRPWLFAALLAVGLLVANTFAQPDFGKPSNWPTELATMAPLVLVAFASTPAIVSGGGGLDLSVGPLAVMINVILIQTLLPHGIDTFWTAMPVLIALGAAVGAINGILVSYLRYVPVIATLCMTFVITGINLKVGGTSHAVGNNWTRDFAGQVGVIPGALILVGIPVLLWMGLSRTSYHRTLYATGGNDVTAFSAGVDVAKARVIAYATGGVFAAFAGVALTALVQSSQASSTSYYILVGLTAVALGGTPLFGGRGGLTGAFFGGAVLYLIQSLLSSLSVPPDWLNIVYGSLLMVGVLVGAALALSRPARLRRGTA
ncbi:MAG: ABC transporter permease [Actinomycetota bacterium]|nr:ABC transporter permease [Actinomycetota bacterium]